MKDILLFLAIVVFSNCIAKHLLLRQRDKPDDNENENKNNENNYTDHKKYPTKCPDWNGTYVIQPQRLSPFSVYCHNFKIYVPNPSWMVVARRFDGSVNFFRTWEDYKNGFGDINEEFFIGLDKLHVITSNQPHKLLITLRDFNRTTATAQYDNFAIGNENMKFSLQKLGNYTGTAGDSLTPHLHKSFLTYDSGNSSDTNCAMKHIGGWWYHDCLDSNLFGLYLNGNYSAEYNMKGMFWSTWQSAEYSLKEMMIMIQPKHKCL